MVSPHAPFIVRRPFLIPECADRSGEDPIFALNAEAARRRAAGESIVNATVGALIDDHGELAVMPSVFEAFARVAPRKAAGYAPIAGVPKFLTAVTRDLFGAGSLAAQSVAVATPGGTGALHHAIVNFLAPGDALLTTDFHWAPYETIAEATRRRIETFAMFDDAGRFDTRAFEVALETQLAAQSRALILLNTPCHNPTGYAFDERDWDEVERIVRSHALDAPIALLVDFAYARFAPNAAERWIERAERIAGDALVLVAWTASKAFAQYGARVGALVAVHPDAEVRRRVQNALAFSCRGTWSNCNHLGMLAITEVLENAELRTRADQEREVLRALLFERVRAFNAAATSANLRYPRYEGGFFVTVFCSGPEAVAKRMRERGVFVVPVDGGVRIALCSTPASEVPRLVDALAKSLESR